MGTGWSVLIDAPITAATRSTLHAELQRAVDEVDHQMSTWRPDSALMRFNAAPVDQWVALPHHLLTVLDAGLAVSARTGGAFEMNLGDAVRAWGFGPDAINFANISVARAAPPISATSVLELDRVAGLARKGAPLSLDLSGIAKGYGVDRLAETLIRHAIPHALCAIDGEVRAIGTRADGTPWSVGVDAPDSPLRGGHSVIALENASAATSGDYRHFLTIHGTRLSHTMNPATRAPMVGVPASVTVLGQSCMMADAMATALMVLGVDRGTRLARLQGQSTLFLTRSGEATGTGLFSDRSR
jgi:thiamine biosynthesis lipoprotein